MNLNFDLMFVSENKIFKITKSLKIQKYKSFMNDVFLLNGKPEEDRDHDWKIEAG